MSNPHRPSFGIVGGLSALAGADLFFKLVKASLATSGPNPGDAILEQHPFTEDAVAGAVGASQTARKLYVFDMIRSFKERRVDLALLPCFISHTFLAELQAELPLPVADLMLALRRHVERRFPGAARLGVLTSDYVRHAGLFESRFEAARWTLVHPRPEIQAECLMPAIYGPHGLKSGQLKGEAVELLRRACQDLADQGAEVILPGCTEIPVVLDSLAGLPVPVVDCNQVYAQFALDEGAAAAPRPFKVGVVGGVGPGATVDFLAKIVRNTPASRDQEHIKLVLEQNPQIPDRTACLVAGGADPTIALYATCKKLEAAGADLVAIPCNTAHAFVERIQPYLGIPIVNMLRETIRQVEARPDGGGTVGLLATDGTVQTRIYQDLAERRGIRMVVPDPAFQAQVMAAIYGPQGVKSGHTDGACREQLLAAMAHLVRDKGAAVLILGCTELPLIVAQSEDFPVAGRRVAVLDPTEILARRCVELAEADRAALVS